jgi:type I restriction enzyme S subunit
MEYSSYPKYVNSRLDSDIKIPDNWEGKRLKFVASHNDESLPETTLNDFEMLYVDISAVDLINGITSVEKITFEKSPSRARRIARTGDTLVSTVRTYLKAITPIKDAPENLIVSTGFAVVRPSKDIDANYLSYFLQNQSFVELVVANSVGVSYPAINASDLVCIPTYYPKCLSEQRQIAAFLDYKTQQIDELIKKKRAIIEKLEENRIAVITQAVTKGMNENVKLNPSNVDWLGDVPEHWKVEKLKFHVTVKGGGTPSTDKFEYWDGDIPWVSPKDMKSEVICETKDYITEIGLENSSASMVDKGSVLIVVRSGILKHSIPVAINSVPVTLNQDMKAISVNKLSLFAEYLQALIYGLQEPLLDTWSKPGCTVESIESNWMMNTLITLPPIDEQKEITEYIEKEKVHIDGMTDKVLHAIQKLEEYRSAIITSAVTGKIDVLEVDIPKGIA